MKENDPLISELANIVGSEHVITDPTSLSVYECDASNRVQSTPRCCGVSDNHTRGFSDSQTGKQVQRAFHRARSGAPV